MAEAILTADLKDAVVPSIYASHPLVANRHYFTVPTELLETIVEHVGEQRFDPKVLELERALSKMSGDHSSQIGFRDGLPIRYDVLARPLGILAVIDEALAESSDLGWDVDAAQRAAFEVAQQQLDWAGDVRRGYAGWLALNPDFIGEQNGWFHQHLAGAKQFGLNGPSILSTDPPPVPGTAAARYAVFAGERDRLLRRWKLDGIAGPYLPVTPGIQAPVLSPHLTDPDLGVTIYIPSTFPLPDRDQLRLLIENAMGRRSHPSHLAGWMSLVAADTVSKSRIAKYGRLFVLQHYWRVVFSRHAESLAGSVGKVKRAFAAFLFPQDQGAKLEARVDTVHKDLGELAAVRGGPDWYLKPAPYDDL